MESEPGADALGLARAIEPVASPPATAGWTRRSPSWRTWPGCRSPSTRRSSSVHTSGSRTPWATRARVSGRYRTAAQASRAAERRPGQRMGTRRRLDAELVREGSRGPVSRPPAWSPMGGCWWLARPRASLPPRSAAADPILVTGAGGEPQYASRGGAKLAGALAAFPGLRVAGRRCLDAGASTGGFTDVLLRAGAAHVVAADVGYGQLAWALRTDERVTVLDRVNVPRAAAGAGGPGTRSGDRRPVLHLADPGPARAGQVRGPGRRFRARWSSRSSRWARARSGTGGVVREPGLRGQAVVLGGGGRRRPGLGVAGVAASPLPGPVEQRRVLPVAAPRRPAARRRPSCGGSSRKDPQ